MAVKASRVAAVFDADASVLLRAFTAGAITSTATETAVPLHELKGAYWQDGDEIPHGVFDVWVDVQSFDHTTGDETYTFALVVDDTSGLSDSPVVLFSVLLPAAVQVYRFCLDSKTIALLNPDHSGTDQWLAARMTLAGTTPSISYAAWIGRNIHA